MKKLALVGAAAMLLSLGLFGCNNTAEGVKQDTAEDTHKVAAAANDAADATKVAADKAAEATKNAAVATADAANTAVDKTKVAVHDTAVATADAANQATNAAKNAASDAGKTITASTEVTPKVKLAILADKELNDTHNKINVNTADGTVHITGNVANNAQKKKATMIAEKALKDLNATDKVANELTVTAH